MTAMSIRTISLTSPERWRQRSYFDHVARSSASRARPGSLVRISVKALAAGTRGYLVLQSKKNGVVSFTEGTEWFTLK